MLESQEGRTNHPGFRTDQRRTNNPRIIWNQPAIVTLKSCPSMIDNRRVMINHTAAQGDCVGSVNINQLHESNRQSPPGINNPLVALIGSRQTQRRTGGQGRKAAGDTAGIDGCVRRSINDQKSEVPRPLMGMSKQFPVQDYPSANARAERKIDEALGLRTPTIATDPKTRR